MTSALAPDDRLALADLASRYAVAVDTRRFEMFHEVFTKDGRLDTGRSIREGVDSILEAMEGIRQYEVTTHLVGQQHIESATDTAANTLTYCTAHHLSPPDADGIQTDMVMFIRYHDAMVRTADGWRIAQRRLEQLWRDTRTIT